MPITEHVLKPYLVEDLANELATMQEKLRHEAERRWRFRDRGRRVQPLLDAVAKLKQFVAGDAADGTPEGKCATCGAPMRPPFYFEE
jgi:hypothetical protein